jgi:hypothetical protein
MIIYSEKLMDAIRRFRQNYARFQANGTSNNATKVKRNLRSIIHLSQSLIVEINKQAVYSQAATDFAELDRLLRIDVHKKKAK